MGTPKDTETSLITSNLLLTKCQPYVTHCGTQEEGEDQGDALAIEIRPGGGAGVRRGPSSSPAHTDQAMGGVTQQWKRQEKE